MALRAVSLRIRTVVSEKSFVIFDWHANGAMTVMDGSNMAWEPSALHAGAVRYGQIDVSRSGLDDFDAADLSAGRSVFLPWAKPGSRTAQPLPPVAPAAAQGRLPSLTGVSVLVVSCKSASLADQMDRLRSQGARLGLDHDLPHALTDLRLHPARWSALIVHADGFGELDDLEETLLAFRHAVPTLPLILVSASFGRDAPGPMPLGLCDVRLHQPVGPDRMKSVLDQAIQHNHTWRQRRAALTPDPSPPRSHQTAPAPVAHPPHRPMRPISQ
jgi:hypothetical protein